MECKKEHFRHIVLFYFRKGKNAAQAAKKLRDVHGEEALKGRQFRNWFDKFHSRDFSLKDEERSGRSNEVDDDQIKAIIESDRHVTVREIEEMLKILKSTIDRPIQRLGLVKKLDIWIPHELKEIHSTKRINACDVHLKRNEFDFFLNELSLVMKNGLFRITSFENDHGPSVMNHHKQHRKLNYIKKRLGIGKVWYFLSCF